MSRDFQPPEPREPPDVDPPDQRPRGGAANRFIRFTLKATAVFLCMLLIMCMLAIISTFWWMVAQFGPLVALGGLVFGVGFGLWVFFQMLVAFVDALAPF